MFTLNGRGKLRVVDKPLVMGIINVTPDSFYAGSRFTGIEAIVEVAGKMIREGADLLDIGGQSTRPGATRVSISEESDRVAEAIAAVHREYPDTWISVDSFYGDVVQAAAEAGAVMVNDISAGRLDPGLIPLVASLNMPYVCMHMQGVPASMQQAPAYQDLLRELLDFFIGKTAELRKAGVKDIIVDPGFGFGKTTADNFLILQQLDMLRLAGHPLMVGLSRKSTIYRTLGISAEEALNGTTVLHTLALTKGADILRVHDVREAREAIALVRRVQEAQ